MALGCRADGEPVARHGATERFRGSRAPWKGWRGGAQRRKVPLGGVGGGGGGGVGGRGAGLLHLPRCGQRDVDLFELAAELDNALVDDFVSGA